MAHTKGPWEIGGNIDSEAGVVSKDRKWVVQPQSMTEEDKENLRLIAAAPELYEALQQARMDLISQFGRYVYLQNFEYLDAALAKAGGK